MWTATSSRSWSRRTPTSTRRPSGRSTAGSTPSTVPSSSRHSAGSATTTPRASTTSPTSSPSPTPTACPWAPIGSTTSLQTEGANDRGQLAALGAELNRRIVERWMRDGVTVMDPATTWIDADVTLEADVTILPGVQLLGATAIAEDAVVGPDSHPQGRRGGPRGPGGAHPRRARRGGRRGDRRAVLVPAAGDRARRRRQDRWLRGDQERPDRRGCQGAAPLLRRRRRDRRGHQHRRGHDLRQLRRRQEAPHDGRPARPDRLATTPSSRR